MEFLAESIGLLDLDSSSRAYVAPAPENSATTAPREGTNSLSLFGWWSNTVGGDVENEEDSDVDTNHEASNNKEDATRNEDSIISSLQDNPNNSYEEDDLEEYLFHENSDLLGPSAMLNLSASSLNIKSPQPEEKSIDSLSLNGDDSFGTDNADTVITKKVTHRLSSSGSFTGNVDALTGQPIHGTLIYKTGSYYEGPFSNDACGKSVRHGHGECTYTNGDYVKFVGRYEWDKPKSGIWFGDGWVYEGELASMDDIEHINASKTRTGVGSKVIGLSTPLPDSVFFHGTGRFMKTNGYIYEGEFMIGLASGVGKEILPDGKGVYYGEFFEGLRHGVGTIIEDCCDTMHNTCEVRNEEDNCSRLSSICDEKDGEILETTDDVSLSSVDIGDGYLTDQSKNGPDFAAGGSTSTTMSEEHPSLNHGTTALPLDNSTNDSSNSKSHSPICETPLDIPFTPLDAKSLKTQHTPKSRTQRYTSGVWIAGQYEIEDSCEILHRDSNHIFNTNPVIDNDQISQEDSTEEVGSPSLNRTTWDLLPEKWLGL